MLICQRCSWTKDLQRLSNPVYTQKCHLAQDVAWMDHRSRLACYFGRLLFIAEAADMAETIEVVPKVFMD